MWLMPVLRSDHGSWWYNSFFYLWPIRCSIFMDDEVGDYGYDTHVRVWTDYLIPLQGKKGFYTWYNVQQWYSPI